MGKVLSCFLYLLVKQYVSKAPVQCCGTIYLIIFINICLVLYKKLILTYSSLS